MTHTETQTPERAAYPERVTRSEFLDALFGEMEDDTYFKYGGSYAWHNVSLWIQRDYKIIGHYAINFNGFDVSLPPSWEFDTGKQRRIARGHLLDKPITQKQWRELKALTDGKLRDDTKFPEYRGQFARVISWHPDRRYSFSQIQDAISALTLHS